MEPFVMAPGIHGQGDGEGTEHRAQHQPPDTAVATAPHDDGQHEPDGHPPGTDGQYEDETVRHQHTSCLSAGTRRRPEMTAGVMRTKCPADPGTQVFAAAARNDSANQSSLSVMSAAKPWTTTLQP